MISIGFQNWRKMKRTQVKKSELVSHLMELDLKWGTWEVWILLVLNFSIPKWLILIFIPGHHTLECVRSLRWTREQRHKFHFQGPIILLWGLKAVSLWHNCLHSSLTLMERFKYYTSIQLETRFKNCVWSHPQIAISSNMIVLNVSAHKNHKM